MSEEPLQGRRSTVTCAHGVAWGITQTVTDRSGTPILKWNTDFQKVPRSTDGFATKGVHHSYLR